MSKQRVALLSVVLVAVGALAWTLTRPTRSAASDNETIQRTLPVETLTVRASRSYGVRESYAGRVVARRASALGFERSGRLERVAVDEGEPVEAGQVLAELDTRALRAERRRLQAEVARFESRRKLARVTTERRRALRESDHLAPQQLDEAVYEEQAIAAQLRAARAALDAVDVSLDLSRIEAPYAGSITARLEDEGTVVTPGQPILRLIEDGALEVQIGVPPTTAAGLEVGSSHEVEIEGRRFGAHLHAVVATVEPDTRTVTAIFRLEQAPAGAFRNGALARVALERSVEADGFWLPISALAESRRGLWSAYALGPDPQPGDPHVRIVDRRQLDLIHAEADRAFVRGTLRDGESIVRSGLHRLVPGQRVRVGSPTP